jgi:hypothetical protein
MQACAHTLIVVEIWSVPNVTLTTYIPDQSQRNCKYFQYANIQPDHGPYIITMHPGSVSVDGSKQFNQTEDGISPS